MSLDKTPWGLTWVRRPDAVLEFLAEKVSAPRTLGGARGCGTTCRVAAQEDVDSADVDTGGHDVCVWLSEEILPVDEGTGVFCIMCVILFVCESLGGMCTVCVCGEMWFQ